MSLPQRPDRPAPIPKTSSYSDGISGITNQIIDLFSEAFSLRDDYRQEDILPGDRYGLINWYEFGAMPGMPERTSGANWAQIRGQMLISVGAKDYLGIEDLCVQELVNFEQRIAWMRSQLKDPNGIIIDFKVDGKVSSGMKRQMLESPHYWISDIVADFLLQFIIYKDIGKFHNLKETL